MICWTWEITSLDPDVDCSLYHVLFLQPEPEIYSFVFQSLIIDIHRELSDFNKDVTTINFMV